MSKRNNEGDVLFNKVNLALAKHQKSLAAMLGSMPEEPNVEKLKAEEERAELEDRESGFEQLGVGGKIPKDVADGSFTRRTLTSNDKLLQQLMGKRAAKAHIAAKQAPKTNLNAQKNPARYLKKEDSEDEDEGRAAHFKSKRSKTIPVSSETPDANELSEGVTSPANQTVAQQDDRATSDDDVEALKPKPKSRKAVSRPGSYLDEILNQRSKKKNKKSTGGD
ncbi:hypothetical protein BU24DRAFT_462446 [Aaosphaeria arxii CBS 175.79]|uniref:Uncharacterized protein n=1 Tax=Aaosphaeria arxii CBS 175.79 TaxID=1450172 RepID=A0A6A5XTJ5_9PLEO|nr:uncharacterized protein BU24DRAFT_462446 [Aaosphaeria arxii CBS 175.79]KAF2016273.1 hypothetical protein BU24DRAFT_462446 [Aaosphaeria arxii CBS 175.79]